jgi:hypothetical protein
MLGEGNNEGFRRGVLMSNARVLMRRAVPKEITYDTGDSSFVRQIRSMSSRTPTSLADAYKSATEAMEKISPMKAQAQEFIAAARKRKASGLLNDETAKAEVTKAETVARLCGLLEKIYQNASGSEDAVSLERVSIGAKILMNRVETSFLLRPETYPQGKVQGKMVEAKISRAQRVFETVCNTLEQAIALAGAEAPVFAVTG